MTRPQCSVYIAASVDGFIARPNGGIDWLSIVERQGEDYAFASFFSIIPILLGEGTPLAPSIGRDVRLELADHRAFESGLVQVVYRAAKHEGDDVR